MDVKADGLQARYQQRIEYTFIISSVKSNIDTTHPTGATLKHFNYRQRITQG